MEKMVVPSTVTAPSAHEDMPEDCRAVFEEARVVHGGSPRAAAALLRLAIQVLLPKIGGKGANINDDIADLVKKGLPVEVQQALDICRVVGNNAVHPGTIDLNDKPEYASEMFGLINFIIDDRISRPKRIAALYGKLPQGARDAVAARDGKPQP